MLMGDELPDEETARTRRMASRLIVNVGQFERMLSRRGYRWSLLTTNEQAGVMYSIQRAGDTADFWAIDGPSFVYQTLLSVEERLDRLFGGGQHHMQCRTCQTPLLRAVEGRTTQFYVYRSLAVRGKPNGPSSQPIATCPGCGAALGIGQVIEIEDVAAEEERKRA